MENSARYTLIGAFALACLLAAFSFVYWIKNVGGIGQRAVYEIRFEQPVSGLAVGGNVLFNGIRAGAVTRIVLDPNNPKRITVTIALDPGDSRSNRHPGRCFLPGAYGHFVYRAQGRIV